MLYSNYHVLTIFTYVDHKICFPYFRGSLTPLGYTTACIPGDVYKRQTLHHYYTLYRQESHIIQYYIKIVQCSHAFLRPCLLYTSRCV